MFASKNLFKLSSQNLFKLPMYKLTSPFISRHMSTLFNNLEQSVYNGELKPLFYNTPSSYTTYGDFMNTVSRFRGLLKHHNVQPGDNIVIFGNNSQKWAGLAYAVWAEGGIIVPTYDKQQLNVKRHMINEIEPKIVFNSNPTSIKKIGDAFVEIDHENILLPDCVNLLTPNVSEHDTASILYTSGTTGLSKGVKLSHYNIISNMKGVSKRTNATPIDSSDRYVSFLPWSHCYGLNCELNYLIWKGASTYINQDLTKLRDNFLEYNPTVLCGVPKLFHEIHKKINIGKLLPGFLQKMLVKKTFGTNLRFATIGGASVDPGLLRFYDDLGVKLVQGYGITETSPMLSLNDIKSNKIGSVGKVLDGTHIEIVNGEIWASGPTVSSGYYLDRDSESFEEKDGKRYFKTGDGGRIDDDGYLYITGRIKETFKLSNGKFVNPEEVEQIILTNVPKINQIMVYAKGCDEFTSAIVVTDLNQKDVLSEINKLNIDKYKIPRNIITTKEAFTIDNDLVTPKQSIKRNKVMEYFKLG